MLHSDAGAFQPAKRQTLGVALCFMALKTDFALVLCCCVRQDTEHPGHDDHQGIVEPALKMYLRKTTSHIVNYIQRAHGLVLGALVVEHVRNLDGKVSHQIFDTVINSWCVQTCVLL